MLPKPAFSFYFATQSHTCNFQQKFYLLKRKFTLLVVVIFLGSIISEAQVIRRPVGAPYIGLGAYSKHHQDIFSFTSNQAALAEVSKAAVGVYGERRFFLNDLNNYVAALALPTNSGNFGLKTTYFWFVRL